MKAHGPLTLPEGNTQRRPWLWFALGLGACVATIWGWQHEPDAPGNAKHRNVAAHASKPVSHAAPSDVRGLAEQTRWNQTPHPLNREHPEPDYANDGHAERPHSHPIDEKRQRIYRENNLSFAMMGAMNVGDYLGLRALIEEYHKAYPEDEYQLQEGYTLIADCIERLTPERQSEAREYWQHNRASMVRRFIRRHCLDKPAADG